MDFNSKIPTIILSIIQIAFGIALITGSFGILRDVTAVTANPSLPTSAVISGVLQLIGAGLLCGAGVIGVLSTNYKSPFLDTSHLLLSSGCAIISATMLYSSAVLISSPVLAQNSTFQSLYRYYIVIVAFSALSLLANVGAGIVSAAKNISKLKSLELTNTASLGTNGVAPQTSYNTTQTIYNNTVGTPLVNFKA